MNMMNGFPLESEKPYRVLIHNLHPFTACDDIKLALENLNLMVLQEVNVVNVTYKKATLLFS